MSLQTGTLTAADGTPLFTRTWTPELGGSPGRALVIVHGYGDHSGRFAHVADYFTRQGYTVHALDLRGHGQSRGKLLGYFDSFDRHIDDLDLLVGRAVEQNGGRPVFILGHSMGALVSVTYAIRQPPPDRARGMILSAPLLDMNKKAPLLVRVLLQYVINPFFKTFPTLPVAADALSRDRAVVEAYTKDPDVLHRSAPVQTAVEMLKASNYARANLGRVTLPLLVMQGASDRLVSPDCAKLVIERAASTDKTLRMYDGLYHEILNEPEQARVMADMAAWMIERAVR
jgi:alpha-beta hydrolase superfamily lysophospholipase